MTCGSIYKIQFPNGKHYIGLTTTSLKQRTKEHKSCAKNDERVLYKALRKYNMIDTFEIIEIDTANTLEELCEKEILYIQEYNSYYMNENGYNMTYGGEGVIGYVFTEEDRQRISEAQKKRFENPEEKEKQSKVLKEYYENNPEAIKINSEAQKKRFENPEAIQKQSEALKEYYKNNPEARQQMSEKMKKYYEENPEAIQKNSEAQKTYNKQYISRKSERTW